MRVNGCVDGPKSTTVPDFVPVFVPSLLRDVHARELRLDGVAAVLHVLLDADGGRVVAIDNPRLQLGEEVLFRFFRLALVRGDTLEQGEALRGRRLEERPAAC